MSYCRFSSQSDVYIYQDITFGLRCCGCPFEGTILGSFDTRSRTKMLAHIAEHRNAGHAVPSEVDAALRDEIDVDGDDAPGDRPRGTCTVTAIDSGAGVVVIGPTPTKEPRE